MENFVSRHLSVTDKSQATSGAYHYKVGLQVVFDTIDGFSSNSKQQQSRLVIDIRTCQS